LAYGPAFLAAVFEYFLDLGLLLGGEVEVLGQFVEGFRTARGTPARPAFAGPPAFALLGVSHL